LRTSSKRNEKDRETKKKGIGKSAVEKSKMKGGKSDAANVERMPYQTAINVSNFFIDCFFLIVLREHICVRA